MNSFAFGRNYARNERGVTLFELLLVLALISILSFPLISAYQAWIAQNQLKTLVNTMGDALEYARETAMTLHTTTVFCGTSDGIQCDSHWQQGQLVMNAQTQRVLQVLPAVPARYRLSWQGAFGDDTALSFRADGFTRGQQGSFLICDQKQTAESAKLVILESGRVRVEMGRIAECI